MWDFFFGLFVSVHNFSSTEAGQMRGGRHEEGLEGVWFGGEVVLVAEGVTFPFTGCQSIKDQSTAVRTDRQHRKEQGAATETPSPWPSLISWQTLNSA